MTIFPINSTQIIEIANNYQIKPSGLLNISLDLSPISL